MKILLKILLVLLLLLGASTAFYYKSFQKQKIEAQRLKTNQTALLSTLDTFRSKNGQLAVTVGQLTLTKAELEKSKSDLVGEVKNLKIRLKDVQTISAIHTQTAVTTPYIMLKDTIILPDTLAKTFTWRDNWTRLAGIIKEDKARIDYVANDTIRSVGHRVRYKFLFIRYGTKEIRQTVTNKNPHTTIIYNEFIKVE